MDDTELRETEAALTPAERELWVAIQQFVDGQVASGLPRERARAKARNLLRQAKEIRALARRGSFKVIEPDKVVGNTD